MAIAAFSLITILWLIAAGREILFWAYFWQVKEYRLDRMRAHFELPTARRLLWGVRTWGTAGLLLAACASTFAPILAWPLYAAATLWYGLRTYRAFIAWQENSLRRPRFTMRGLIMLGTSALFGILALVVALLWNTPAQSFSQKLLPFIVFDLLAPAWIALGAALTEPLSEFSKRRLIAQAKDKRASMPNLLVIGITGSYAKTSVKEYLAHMLEGKFRVHKTPANANTEVAIAREFLKNVTPQHEIFVVEIGAYREGEIALVCDMLKPQIGILTGLNTQHVSLFGSVPRLQKAKYELIASLPAKGLAIFNGENEQCRTLFKMCKKPKRLYALKEIQGADVWYPAQFSWNEQGVRANFSEGERMITLQAPLLGKHNVLNLTAATLAAHELGMTMREIAERCATLRAPAHTMQMKKGIKHATIIDDSYTANTDGVLAALEILKSMKAKRKICILQPLIELGKGAKDAHAEIGKALGLSCQFCIVTSPDYFPILKKEALAMGMKRRSLWCISDPYIAMRKAQELCNEGDVVLLENRIPEIVVKGLVVE